jgi:cytochrome c-type biogenesis protein CcmE
MSRIDDELAQAVAESEAAAPAVEAPTRVAKPKAPRRNLGLLVGLLVMGGGILALVLTSFENATVYARGVEELARDKEKLSGRNVRVQGNLVKGSLVHRPNPCEYRFEIENKGATLPVRYSQCIVPDNFRDVPGMDVVVITEGKLAEGGHFEASSIMAQCPSKYEMQQRAQRGEKAPHAGVPPAPDLRQN